jgi:hypothetical protein
MQWDVPAAEMKHVLGLFPAYAIVIALSPVFLILAVLYMFSHPNRADANARENPAGVILPIRQIDGHLRQTKG